MNTEINRIKWKSRRGMRELDLLFQNFFKLHASKMPEEDLKTLEELLAYDDQSLFDFIFKDVRLGDASHEDFIQKYLKKYGK